MDHQNKPSMLESLVLWPMRLTLGAKGCAPAINEQLVED